MSRESSIFLIGLLIFFLPVIGVPSAWKDYFLFGAGVLLILLGVSLRRSAYLRKISQAGGELRSDSFVESQPSLLDIDNNQAENREV